MVSDIIVRGLWAAVCRANHIKAFPDPTNQVWGIVRGIVRLSDFDGGDGADDGANDDQAISTYTPYMPHTYP
jgi:hypothetical protein